MNPRKAEQSRGPRGLKVESEAWPWWGGSFTCLMSSKTCQFSKQPSPCEVQAWKQGGAAGSGFQQRGGVLGRGARAGRQPALPFRSPRYCGWGRLLGGGAALYLGRVGGRLHCDVTGSGGLFQTPKYLLHLLPGAGTLSELERKLAGSFVAELTGVQASPPSRSRCAQILWLERHPGLGQDGLAASPVLPQHLLENPWVLKAVVSSRTPSPAQSRALGQMPRMSQASCTCLCPEEAADEVRVSHVSHCAL